MVRSALTRRAREMWLNLSRLEARPDRIAAGFSIGVAASLVPLNPSPVIAATALAWLLGRSPIAAVAGATTAMPFTPFLPVLWLTEYRLGITLLPVRHPPIATLWDAVRSGWDVYAAMAVGAAVIAAPATALTYWAVRRLAEKWTHRTIANSAGASPVLRRQVPRRSPGRE